MAPDGDTTISCKECGKLYWGPGKVFSIMYHLIQCGTNEKERKKIIDDIVNENLRLGSWESDESIENTLHKTTRFETEPLSSCSISRFINIHIMSLIIWLLTGTYLAQQMWEGTHQNSG